MSTRVRAQTVLDAKYTAHGEGADYSIWDEIGQVLGVAAPITVIPTTSERILDLLGGSARQSQNLFLIRATEVATPKEQDAVDYNGKQYRVVAVTTDDTLGLEWVVSCGKGTVP